MHRLYRLSIGATLRIVTKNWQNEHPQYTLYTLEDDSTPQSPWKLWETWQQHAARVMKHTNEIAISTCGTATTGDTTHIQPTVRMALLKKYNEHTGFFWYSKARSEKGLQISEHPWVEILWYARELQRQVRIRGTVCVSLLQDASDYARSRPRKSQISAYISQQSKPIASRKILEQAYKKAEMAYAHTDIPVSKDWALYTLMPLRFEFWQGRADRLHDRIVYERDSVGKRTWTVQRLQP